MAAVAVTTTMAGAVNYTYVTDTSADWAAVPNSTYFYDKADKLVHYKNSGGTILEIFSAGGLTKFTEAEATTSPNNTVYVDSLTAAGSTTNVDIAIVPKGTGAFMLDIPDNTATGGNKRGSYAVDLQTRRDSASQVSSGEQSFSAGRNNIASGSYSTALGVDQTASGSLGSFSVGYFGTASGIYSFKSGYSGTSSGNASTSMGYGSTASGDASTAIGGSCLATGESSVSLGSSNTANSNYSVALGRYASVFGITGRLAICQLNTNTGDCQKSIFPLSRRTTDANATTLTINGTSPSATNQVILSNQSAYRFKGSIVGKQQGSVNAAVWDVDGFIVRGANAAATTLNVSNVTLVQNTPAWGTPTLAADTTNGGLQVQVTGAAATNIQWTAVIETTEVIYA